jgi:predicted RNase H-like HicB family nuclease
MRLRLTAVFHEVPEGGYVASVMGIPGAMTQGETFEEAHANLKDAVRLLIETKQALGSPHPAP